MKIKTSILCALLTAFLSALLIMSAFEGRSTLSGAQTFYRVYLDGKSIGLIENAQAFFDLINQEQEAIREQFGVDRVYPPNGFNILRYTTHRAVLSTPEEIYKQIKDEQPFTISGYIIMVRNVEENTQHQIHVLDQDLFVAAAKRFTNVFIDAEVLEDFQNDTQAEIEETGELLTYINWVETPDIRRGFISVEEKIFTDLDTLSQFLLYGTNEEGETYIVAEGDTIESIAYAHELNTEEFLIANPRFTSATNILAIGEEVSIALIAPVMEVLFDKIMVEDEAIPYETEVRYDFSLPVGFSEVSQQGEPGLRRIRKQMQFTNGAPSQEAPTPIITILQEPVTEIITRGRVPAGRPPDPTGTDWGWPTNQPSIITSPFGWRWGRMHSGIDISGTGWASPIRSVQDGTIWRVGNNPTLGLYVIIQHANNHYTVYGHLMRIDVRVGQSVTRGQIIGGMGNTGRVVPMPTPQHPHRGTHLHFEVWNGPPWAGGRVFNPMLLWRR